MFYICSRKVSEKFPKSFPKFYIAIAMLAKYVHFKREEKAIRHGQAAGHGRPQQDP
jgi:hypothetical protein